MALESILARWRYGRGNFPSGLPQDNKGRLSACLENTQDGPHRYQPSEVLACCMAPQYHSPCNDIERQVLGNGNALDDKIGWVFDYQDCDVDTGSQP